MKRCKQCNSVYDEGEAYYNGILCRDCHLNKRGEYDKRRRDKRTAVLSVSRVPLIPFGQPKIYQSWMFGYD